MGFPRGRADILSLNKSFYHLLQTALFTLGGHRNSFAHTRARASLEVYTANHQQSTPNTAGFQLHIVVQKNQRPNGLPLIVNSPRRASAVCLLFTIRWSYYSRIKRLRKVRRVAEICLPGSVVNIVKLKKVFDCFYQQNHDLC